jgi:hypothetical protein
MAKKDKWKNIPIDREEEEFQRQVRKRHIELFPEEYDHMFDSISDARERQKGRSPADLEHMARVNETRMEMGFEPLSENGYATSRDTFRFVEERMRAGKDVRLEDLISGHSKAEEMADQDKEIAPKGSDAGSTIDQRIDRMLAGDAFTYEGQDRSDPQVIAFRVLGELFELNRSGDNEPEFFRQIRRLLTGRSESEYQALYRHAMNEWMEAYGY